jgi:hypothetical protein
MRRSLFLVALLAVIAAVVPLAKGHHQEPWHWRRASNPVTLTVVNGASGVWKDNVNGAARRWNKMSDVVTLSRVNGSNVCNPVRRKIAVCSGNFGQGWAGLTEVAQDGPHVVWALIRLDNSAAVAARAVSCHELGHALGLAHRPQSETTSCMTSSVGAAQTRPDRHDIRTLRRIYRHVDGFGAARSTGELKIQRIRSRRVGDLVIHSYATYL